MGKDLRQELPPQEAFFGSCSSSVVIQSFIPFSFRPYYYYYYIFIFIYLQCFSTQVRFSSWCSFFGILNNVSFKSALVFFPQKSSQNLEVSNPIVPLQFLGLVLWLMLYSYWRAGDAFGPNIKTIGFFIFLFFIFYGQNPVVAVNGKQLYIVLKVLV